MSKLIILGLILTSVAFAFGDWLQMQKTGSQSINYTYSKCFYKESFGNFTISIVVRGGVYSCPYSIQYNPMNNAWK